MIPTTPLTVEGQTIDPLVSVPIAKTVKFAETETPDPELEPHGFLDKTYGFFVCPLTPLHPLVDLLPLKFAHSLKFALPKITAPASYHLMVLSPLKP